MLNNVLWYWLFQSLLPDGFFQRVIVNKKVPKISEKIPHFILGRHHNRCHSHFYYRESFIPLAGYHHAIVHNPEYKYHFA